MSEVLELWSLPWHALQRSLAKGFGADAPAVAPRPAPIDGEPASSWLMRAQQAAGWQSQASGSA
jgi:hypothetical protein